MSTEPGHTALRSRPDAVDLVVEDHRTPEAVVAHERQHTEPKSYDARRPVSRWLVSSPQREVGTDVRGDSSLVQSTAHWEAEAEEMGTEAGVAVGTVVRLETPPLAQAYDDIGNDENPWT